MVKEKTKDDYPNLKDYTDEEINELRKALRTNNYAILNSYVGMAKASMPSEQSSVNSGGATPVSSAAPNSSRTPAATSTASNTGSKLPISAIKDFLKNSEIELERDLDTKHNPVKPFVLHYDSVLDSDRQDNIENVIKALKNEEFKAKYPTAYKEGLKIVEILEKQRSGILTKDEAKQQLKDLQKTSEALVRDNIDRPKVSHKTRARLARQLQLAGNCDYGVRIEKLPDMAWLIPVTYCTNVNDYVQFGYGKKGGDRRFFDPKWRRQWKQGLFYDPRPQYSNELDEEGLTVRDRLVRNLKRRKNDLESMPNSSSDVIDFYNLVIDAYESNDWEKIKRLNSEINTMERVAAAYDIRHHACFVYPPDNYEQHDLSVTTSSDDIIPPVIDKTLNGYTSDEWMQMLNQGANAAYNQANNLSEGIVITSLRTIKGADFADRFANEEMTLENKEDLLKQLSPAELSKFSMSILKSTETLAEILPPHFMTMMAQRIDGALTTRELSDDDKANLTLNKNILLAAMVKTVEDYKNNNVSLDSYNAAGVYDGAVEMAQYLRDNLNENKDGINQVRTEGLSLSRLDDAAFNSIKSSLDDVFLKEDSVLNKAIKGYDEYHYLSTVTKDSEKDIAIAYEHLSKQADELVNNEKFEEEFNKLLDTETKKIFEALEFSKAEDKKDFMSSVVYIAAQQAATQTAGKKKKDQEDAFNAIINNIVIEETLRLIQAEDAVQASRNGAPKAAGISETDDLQNKKAALSRILTSKMAISNDAMAGYFASVVNRQSIWVNRLATKIKNRAAPVLQKMWKPFQKLDKTCIARFGKTYQIARGIFKQSLTNLPWSISNAVARVAAFSQIGTPWGAACVGCYAAYSFGSTLFRMEMQRRRLKKQDPNNPALKTGKFFLKNWDGILLSVAGTSLSCIPGLASGFETLKPVVNTMKDLGLMNVSSLYGANFLGMSNASLGLTAAGVIDSAVKGVKANRKLGNSWLKSIGDSLGISILSSASGIATGVACGQVANSMFDNMGFNTAADIRTVTNEVTDDGFKEGSPSHDPDADYSSTSIENNDIRSGLNETDQKAFNQLLENIDNAKSETEGKAAIEKMTEFLEKHGMSVKAIGKNENGNFTISWETPGKSGYTEGAVEHAAKWAADWQRDVPGLHDENINAIKGNSNIAEFNARNPMMAVDENRMEMILMLSGAQAVPADQDSHVNIDAHGNHHDVRGNHCVIDNEWIDKYGANTELTKYTDGEPITKEDIVTLRALHNRDGSINVENLNNLTDHQLKVINALDHFISDRFEVGDIESTREDAIGPKYLGPITKVNPETGEHQHAEGKDADRMNTYSNGNTCRDDTQPVFHDKSYGVEKHYKTNHYYMPINPSVDLYTFVKKVETKLSKIIGNHGKKQNDNVLKPFVINNNRNRE